MKQDAKSRIGSSIEEAIVDNWIKDIYYMLIKIRISN